MKTKYLYICLLLLIGFVGLSSCKVGKPYARPDLQLPDSIIAGQDSVSMGDMQWWQVYADSSLMQIINQALDYNKDMLIASARIREMAERKRISTAALIPNISGRVNDNYERENHGGDALKAVNTFDVQLLFSWEIDLWGNLRWGRTASVAQYLQTVEAQRALQMTIVSEVAQAYYELVALDTELEIVRQTLKAREEGLQLAKIRFEGGLTSETSYRQAVVEHARTAALVPDLERRIALKESDIAFLTGDYPRAVERGKLLTDFTLPDNLPVGLPSDLLERRPDIRQAEQRLVAIHAQMGVAYTDMFPRIRLTAGAGVETLDMAAFFRSPYETVAASLLTPIFNWGKLRAAWKASKAAYEAETYAYEKAVLNAFKETHNAIVNYNKMQEIYEMRVSLENSARSYLDLAQLQYINGVINYMDVLDAQRGYFDAQIGLSNAIRDELLAVVQLYKSLGGGWQVPDEQSVPADNKAKTPKRKKDK
ncbi:MAG: efflux transporter outer membrane subunit [Bacteroidales bacterium]|nr:efflux transporter outer membrane subunit [Bacteroidales bacterium]